MRNLCAAALAVLLAFAVPMASAQTDPADQKLMELSMMLSSMPEDETSPEAAEQAAKASEAAREFLLAYPEHPVASQLFGIYPQLLGVAGKTEAEVEAELASLIKESGNSELAVAFEINKAIEALGDEASPAAYYATVKTVYDKHPDSATALGMVVQLFPYADLPNEEKLAQADALIASGKLDEDAVDSLKAWRKQASAIGTPVSFQFTDLDGNEVDTKNWKGKVILVDFWATWCGPCVAEMPRMKKIYAEYHPQGLEILGISCDRSAEPLKKFVEQKEIPWTQWPPVGEGGWHPKATEWGVQGIPTMFLIDKKGILRSVEARGDMEEMIPMLLAEEDGEAKA